MTGKIIFRPGPEVSLYLPSCSTMPCWKGWTILTLDAATMKTTKAMTIRAITAGIGSPRSGVRLCLFGSLWVADRSDDRSCSFYLDHFDLGPGCHVGAVGGLGVPVLAAYPDTAQA